jgi:hypothetical protein
MIDDARKSFPKIDWLISAGLILAALVIYTLTLAPTVLEADAGEFQFVSWAPGIAHPTGYPLYILLGWVWTHLLPIGEVAWRMNLLSALFAALAVGVTFSVARKTATLTFPQTSRWARVISALIAASTFAVTHTFWTQALMAEVYALHTLIIVAIFWLALTFSHQNEPLHGLGKLLALTFGLGLTHHVTTILLAPALLLFLWVIYSGQRSMFFDAKVIVIYAILFIAPLLLYLYLPLIASNTPYVTLRLSDNQTLTLYDNSLRGFISHITGTVFAGQLQPAAVGSERLIFVWRLMRQQFGWVGVLLAAIGLLTLWKQRQIGLLALTGVAFAAFITFNLIYFIGDVFVLFIPAWLIACLWLGIGCLALADWGATHFARRKMGANPELVFEQMRDRLEQNMRYLVTIAILLFFFGLPLTLLSSRWPAVDQSGAIEVRARWQEILAEPIPTAAILLTNDRNEIMPMWYYQFVEGRRPDLLGLFPLITPEPGYENVGGVLGQALASGRLVYFIKPMADLALKADITPAGSLFKVTPGDMSPAVLTNIQLPPVAIIAPGGQSTHQETILLAGYTVSTNALVASRVVTVTLFWQPTQPLQNDYTSYVHLLTVSGEAITQSDHRPGGIYYPSSDWQVGETLRDTHTLTLPEAAPPGNYRLRVGMYLQPQPGLFNGMGEGVVLENITLAEPTSLLAPAQNYQMDCHA